MKHISQKTWTLSNIIVRPSNLTQFAERDYVPKLISAYSMGLQIEYLDNVTMVIYFMHFMLMFVKLLQQLHTVGSAEDPSTYSGNLLLYNTL
jgi:hypothetical protein